MWKGSHQEGQIVSETLSPTPFQCQNLCNFPKQTIRRPLTPLMQWVARCQEATKEPVLDLPSKALYHCSDGITKCNTVDVFHSRLSIVCCYCHLSDYGVLSPISITPCITDDCNKSIIHVNTSNHSVTDGLINVYERESIIIVTVVIIQNPMNLVIITITPDNGCWTHCTRVGQNPPTFQDQ